MPDPVKYKKPRSYIIPVQIITDAGTICTADDKIIAFRLPQYRGIEYNPFSLSNDSSDKAYKISNPLTQNNTAQEIKIDTTEKYPVTEIYAAVGAIAKLSPNTK